MKPIEKVAIVGSGLVGRGWTIVFARAGIDVAVYDSNAGIRAEARDRIAASLADMKSAGLIDDVAGILARVSVVDGLEEAVAEADYVQESVLERTDVKKEASLAIDAVMRSDAVVGSSSSGIPASAFTQECRNRSRFLIAHPVNPPHLVPVVELVPAPWTDRDIMPWLRGEMERTGQAPIAVDREIEGFILNRLQGVLLMEAWKLFEEGYASAADIDLTISKGLGMRWSFAGPFETIDLNAPCGVRDYAERFGPLYQSIAKSRTDPKVWSDDLIARVEAERRSVLPETELRRRSEWRDRRLMALVAHQKDQPQ
ncbi:3-hydroxyacyl-CoA dehydrogenase [Aurantimonas sp. VKM B-3413]|uniref:3-hydroxyacyl-CoA dehydrogenase n=1 Tax=Aurantimonas sp. VKM B-3413 TaxID=2779401 RepID=UPI001E2EEA34|nr:3-hydroxyacyl-CoA dehydrogenase [Aurantimonas sp. VKM B-3413]MCB8840503.1 3-hydroxyacyl-CoA dehydrogenase [Aurantimonas sp. VKM B-3413]